VQNGKNRLIYEAQEVIFSLKFALKLLKLLFSAGKITKKSYFQLSIKKIIKSSIKKNLLIIVFASLKESNRLKHFFFQICIFIFQVLLFKDLKKKSFGMFFEKAAQKTQTKI
jgi:hypothetical protein